MRQRANMKLRMFPCGPGLWADRYTIQKIKLYRYH